MSPAQAKKKKCSSCKLTLPITEYTKNKTRKDGLSHDCKKCKAKKAKSRHAVLKRRKKIKLPKTQICQDCKQKKPPSEFHNSKDRASGLYGYCKECTKWKKVKTLYGITKEEWLALFKKQGECCGSCGTKDPGKQGWVTDHRHIKDGEKIVVRGILCHGCNTSEGLLGSDPDRCIRLAKYLQDNATL